ncbi:hypothetical protein [Nocardia sp. NPDC057030]|uniref:hypothetical protein n=1 Tax=unclassified Nocardia TaxID=2637762 RepID=UPI00362E4E6A
MSGVIDLDRRRRYGHRRCDCGSEWFTLDGRAAGLDHDAGAVVLAADGRIVAYAGIPRCLECGV